jgi:aspartyl-tRNA synthetase
VVFIDMRDRYGITQTVYDTNEGTLAVVAALAETYRAEFVIKITGVVRARPNGQVNDKIVTGGIEIIVDTAEILSMSKLPPFEISDHNAANEEIRLKHRYLDLRRKPVLDIIEFRARMNRYTREWFSDAGFLEVQTPIFTASSPEGARDYLIPSRLHPGQFYALPQAPQQYKQLLMVGGIDKYFQIAPCFRDEDPRADRHSCEFYQIDCEMSFVEQEDILQVAEKFAKDLAAALTPEKVVTTPTFVRLAHTEALDLYGTDKPDLRFGLRFEDLSEDFRTSGFSVFANAVAEGGVVKAMKLNALAGREGSLTRSEIDALTVLAQAEWAKGLAYIIYEAEGPKSPILKFFTGGELAALEARFAPQVGDVIFFGAGERKLVNKVLGKVRSAIGATFGLASPNELAFVWITDFPMYEQKEDGSYDFEHNPFSMPHGGVGAFAPGIDPLSIYGCQYDLACNGYEILSGSVRNHNIEALVKAFEIVGKGEEEVKAKFGAMYNAFQFGVPPHGGFAFGFDRFLMILRNESNIREIYAFPKSGKAEDTMMQAPTSIDEKQLRELHIKLR